MLPVLSLIVAWVCIVSACLSPLIYLYLAFDISIFEQLVKATLGLPVQWATVTISQWYGVLVVTFCYHSIGLVGLFFLSRAFFSFAKGSFFNEKNSRNIRLFAILIFIQAVLKPVHFAFTSVILSINHPEGQKMLSVMIGFNELKVIMLAAILWVISELIIKAKEIEVENKQFV